jgi:hypothetical protein
MSEARSQLLQRLRALELGIDNASVAQHPTTEADHNQVASLFRQGMAVVAFVALEDFIKRRTSEAMSQISQCGITFSDLPEKLRKATTYGAINSVAFQLKIRPPEEREAYAQESTGSIFSTLSENYNLYEHSFGFDASNINADTISHFLTSICVPSTWQNLTSLAAELELGLDLRSRFMSSADLRHKAAHIPNANIAVGELETLRKNCIAISICFDAITETAIHAFKRRDQQVLHHGQSITNSDVLYCKIKFLDGKWKVTPKGHGRTLRSFSNKFEAENFVLQKAWDKPCCAIFYDESRFASDWKVIR